MTSKGAPSRALVVIPVFGHLELTHAVLSDLQRERSVADIIVVDNGGDYRQFADERVLTPDENLGWARGTNLGTAEMDPDQYAGVIWLNNDTRLAASFVAGLLHAARRTGAGVIAPRYDCYWPHQRLKRCVPVDRFRPRRRNVLAPFVDGTCMYVSAAALDAVGLLDETTFGPVGWGADLDYCFRTRQAGHAVMITDMAYLHHERSVTATTVFGGLEGYAEEGYPAFVNGMESKWGADWKSRLELNLAERARSRRFGRQRPVSHSALP